MGPRVVALAALLTLALAGCSSESADANATDAAPTAAGATNVPPAADKPRAGVNGVEGGSATGPATRGAEKPAAMPPGAGG